MMRYMIRCKCFVIGMVIVVLATGISTGWTSEGIFLPWENTCENEASQKAICKIVEDNLQMMPVNRTQEKNQKKNECELRQVSDVRKGPDLYKSDKNGKYPITRIIVYDVNSVFIQKYIHEQDGEKA